MESENRKRGQASKTRKMVLTAMLFAAAIVLSILENLLPVIPVPVPGVKFGLSNIVVMYALFFLGTSEAFTIAVLKGGFAFLTRGTIAGFLSLAGGVFSIGIMVVLLFLFREKISYFLLGIAGAVFHNIGQFTVISLINIGMSMWYYLPVLLVFGLAAGAATSVLLRFILPAFKKLGLQ